MTRSANMGKAGKPVSPKRGTAEAIHPKRVGFIHNIFYKLYLRGGHMR